MLRWNCDKFSFKLNEEEGLKSKKGKIKPKRNKTTNCLLEWEVPIFGFGVLGHTVCGEEPNFWLIPLHFLVLLVQAKRRKGS